MNAIGQQVNTLQIKNETRRRSPSDPPSSLHLERNVSAHAPCLNGSTGSGMLESTVPAGDTGRAANASVEICSNFETSRMPKVDQPFPRHGHPGHPARLSESELDSGCMSGKRSFRTIGIPLAVAQAGFRETNPKSISRLRPAVMPGAMATKAKITVAPWQSWI